MSRLEYLLAASSSGARGRFSLLPMRRRRVVLATARVPPRGQPRVPRRGAWEQQARPQDEAGQPVLPAAHQSDPPLHRRTMMFWPSSVSSSSRIRVVVLFCLTWFHYVLLSVNWGMLDF